MPFSERKELESLPEEIEALEATLAQLDHRLSDPAIYTDGQTDVPSLNRERTDVARRIESAYTRWEELSERAG